MTIISGKSILFSGNGMAHLGGDFEALATLDLKGRFLAVGIAHNVCCVENETF